MIEIIILCLLQILLSSEQMYDEDLTVPIPIVVLNHSPISAPANTFLANINNCTCRETPEEYSVCFGNNCHKFPTTVNITTPLFKLKITAISTIKKDDLIPLRNILYLEIESNLNLVRLEPGCFRNMTKLQNLTISFNENLNYFEEDVFAGLKSLETLSIRKNGFTNVLDITNALSVKYVPQLFLLDMSENYFHLIDKDAFLAMNGTLLQQLNMVLCEIEYIHPDILAPLKNLTSLRLGQNLYNISVITNLVESSVEQGIPLNNLNLYDMGLRNQLPLDLLKAVGKSKITYLHLTKNNFYHIDSDAFPYMPNLEYISLRDNLIMGISLNAFRGLTNLKSLYIGINRLSQIPDAAMLKTLVELDIAGNTYDGIFATAFNIPDGIFTNMSNMQNLKLEYNNLGSLSRNTFEGLQNLIKLNLKNTSLRTIETGAFFPLINLQYLNLNNNPFPLFMVITADLFKGLNNLQILLLGGCSIKNLTVNPGLFTHVPNLKHVGLERNGLLTISPHQLIPLIYLQSLSIADNKLTPWNTNILPHNNFKILLAGQNKFTYISISMLEDWKGLDILDLEGNPFTCDCSLYPIVIWLKSNKMTVKYDNKALIATCASPDIWWRKSIVEYLKVLNINRSKCENGYTRTQLIISVTFVVIIIILGMLIYIYRWYIEYWLFILRITLRKHNVWNIRKYKIFKKCLNCRYDAFISYCNEDRIFVMNLVEMMENYEPFLKLCVFERDFQIGSVISEAVVESVAVSRRTLLVVSDAFAKSQWCRWETQLAEYHQIFFHNDSADGPDDTLIIIRLGEVSKVHMTPVLKYLMKTRIYLQWHTDPHKHKLFWEKLRNTLSSVDAVNFTK